MIQLAPSASLASPEARPSDPAPRWRGLVLSLVNGDSVHVQDDPYSDRIRCDHPATEDGDLLAAALRNAARQQQRGRVVVLVPHSLAAGMRAAGFAQEAHMPGFYRGLEGCVVLRYALDPERAKPHAGWAEALARSQVTAPRRTARSMRAATTEPATPEDAAEIAALVGQSFRYYPTPTGAAGYVAEQIRRGTPFRVVRHEGRVMACACADLVRDARTAELTDCATHLEQRGRGLMQAILEALMDDLRAMGYPTAFTLARAGMPGMNRAFEHIGFTWRGLMARSCRIGDGIEDISVWSRLL